MRKLEALFVAASLMALGVVACSSSTTTSVVALATPTPLPYCAPSIPVLQLVYPQPGATSVPSSIGSVIFLGWPGYSGFAPLGLVLNGVAQSTLSLAPSPLPTPLPSQSPGFDYLQGTITTKLQASTLYTVAFSILPGMGVCPGNFSVGSFSTAP